MSKFRALCGGLAAIGLLAAVVAGGVLSVRSSHAAPTLSATAVVAACMNCVEADA